MRRSRLIRADNPVVRTRSSCRASPSQRLDDVLGHLLGVAEEHHRARLVEERVVDAGIAGGERALDEEAGRRLVDVEDRHAVDRRGRVVARRRVGHVVGADHVGDVGLRELRVDVLKLEHLVVGDVGFGQEHVHVPRHAAGDRVDGVFHLHALRLQLVGHLAQRVLRLRHRHAVARHDDDLARRSSSGRRRPPPSPASPSCRRRRPPAPPSRRRSRRG